MSSLYYLTVLVAVVVANPVNPRVDEVPPISNDVSYGNALDLAASASQSTFACIKQQGYQTVFVRAYNPAGNGAYDPNGGYNVQNAYKAGLGTEVYMTPQPSSSKSASQQVDELYQGLNAAGVTVRSLWFQITSPINWPNNQNTNRNFIAALVARAQQYKLAPGIYTNSYDWNQITGSWNGLGNGVSLWYWSVHGNGPTGESSADFNDFRAFGSWTSAVVKQYGQAESVCGLTVNKDIYVSGSSQLSQSAILEDGKIVVGGNVHV